MIREQTHSLADLYLDDETAWLDAMATLIREGRLGDLDYPHLAEYIEDMARRDRREVSGRLKILLVHVLKWTYQKNMRTPSWSGSAWSQQDELEFDMESGALRNHAETSLAAIYEKARKLASAETGLPAETFPAECPWTLEQLLSAEVLGD